MKKTAIFVLIVAIFGSGLFLLNMKGWDLWKPDEPRYAQVGKNTFDGEGWLIPHLNGEVYDNKPPLFFCLIALSGKLLGRMDEQAARMPSAVFGILTLILVFFFGRELFDAKTGLFSALILATSGQFYWLARRAHIDVPMTFFITLSIFLFYLGYQRKERRILFYALAYAAMAISGLLKTYPGWIIPPLVISVYFLFKREKGFFIDPAHIWGIFIFIIIVGGWLLLTYMKGGKDYLEGLLFQKTVNWFFTSTGHRQSFFFFFWSFPVEFLPWTLFLPFAVFFGLKETTRRKNFLFLVAWFATVFLLFSFSMIKRSLYLLPLYPAAALMVGHFCKEASHQAGKTKILSWPVFSLFAILFVTGLTAPFVIPKIGTQYLSRPLEVGIISAAIVCVGSILGALSYLRGKKSLSFYVIVLICFSMLTYAALRILPDINKYLSSRPFSQQVVNITGQDGRLATYRCFESYFNFYMGRNRIARINGQKALTRYLNAQERSYCILRKEEWQKLLNTKGRWQRFFITEGKVGKKDFVVIGNKAAKKRVTRDLP